MYRHEEREITKEEYDAIKAGEKRTDDFFSEAELMGYGACPSFIPVEREGKYYIPYGISDSCD